MNLIADVFWQFEDVVVVRNRHVFAGHCNDLVVSFSLIQHMHNSDDFGFHQAEGFYSSAANHQDVKRILVVAVSPGDESVVLRVVDCTKENTIELKEATVLVQLIFDLAFCWDLNNCIDKLGGFFSIWNSVPRILYQ